MQTGRIVGTVRDPQQATVAKAAVTVTSSATGESRTVATSDRGDYVVTPVNPGRYDVTVVGQGFQTAVVTAVDVPVGQSVRVDVELKLGARNQPVNHSRRRRLSSAGLQLLVQLSRSGSFCTGKHGQQDH